MYASNFKKEHDFKIEYRKQLHESWHTQVDTSWGFNFPSDQYNKMSSTYTVIKLTLAAKHVYL